MVYDERIPTSIAIMREKHNLGTCEACACVGQPIHSSQYLGIQAWLEHKYKCGHMWLVPGGNLICCILLICVCKICFVLFAPSGHLAVSWLISCPAPSKRYEWGVVEEAKIPNLWVKEGRGLTIGTIRYIIICVVALPRSPLWSLWKHVWGKLEYQQNAFVCMYLLFKDRSMHVFYTVCTTF